MDMESFEVESIEEKETKFNPGDRVEYKDGRKGKIVGEEGDLHLGEGLINVNFDNGDDEPEGVRVSDLEKIGVEVVKEKEE